MDGRTLHHAEGAGEGAIGDVPDDGVHGLGRAGEEVPGVVVGGLGLGDLLVWFGLDGVDEVGLQRVIDSSRGWVKSQRYISIRT